MIIPVGFAQITYLYGGSAQPTGAAHTIGCAFDGVTDNLGALVSRFRSYWTTYFKGNMGSGTTLVGVAGKLGPNDLGQSIVIAASENGSIGSQGAAPQAAFLVRKFTAVGGRRGRGRMYVPGVYESATNGDGLLTSGVQVGWDADLEDWREACVDDGNELHLFHAQGTPGDLPPAPILALQVDTPLATQRKRMRR